jgi:Cu(I)/Ag(I) efflux system membrane fusion protein
MKKMLLIDYFKAGYKLEPIAKWWIYILFAAGLSLLACNNKPATAHDPDIYYTCSMDPQVIEQKPGKCPICKMDLTPVRKKAGEKEDELELSDQQIRLGNIQSDTIQQGSIGNQLVLTATLNFDQNSTRSISARVMGRVDRLYYKAEGDYVRRGAPLYAIYSEELNNAKQEYLLALERKKSFANETIIDFEQLLQSAKTKLLLWGMSETAIEELEKAGRAEALTTFYSPESGYITRIDVTEGNYVMEGGTLMTLADLSTIWAEAQVYTSQMWMINHGSIASVQIPDLGGMELNGRIEFINPEINPDTRINLLRVSVPNRSNKLKPGMPAYVKLASPKRNSLLLPSDAVIRDSRGATAWVQTANNTFKPVMVEIGTESAGQVEILSGLNDGDVVVMSGAYLLHSEFVFKKGNDPMAGHNH